MTILVFWSLTLLLFWSYIGYPVYLWLKTRHMVHSPSSNLAFLPKVSILISAYNEAAYIKAKIANCLEFEYPADKYEIIIASDGSTDETAEIIRDCSGQNIQLIELPRGGKAKALNALVKKAKGDIFVFTDANAMLGKDSLIRLIGKFNDQTIGCVTALKKIVAGKSAVGEGESTYWEYEYFIKMHESRYGSAVGADGSFYAIKREYYLPVPDDKNIADDLAISMGVWRFQKRIVIAELMLAIEEAHSSVYKEYQRKIRIAEGSYRAILCNSWAIVPAQNRYWLELISHKIIRWAGPFLMIGILFCSLLLSGNVFYLSILLSLILFMLLGFLGLVNPLVMPFIGSLGHFILSNIAQAHALFRLVFKPRPAFWDTRTG